MFKKSGAFALTILYAVTVVGFALNLHYCFSHITAVNINYPAKSCAMPVVSKMKCCQDRHIEVKVKDAHQGQAQSFLSGILGFDLPKFPFSNIFNFLQQDASSENLVKDPPDPPSNIIVTFLKNCVFRI